MEHALDERITGPSYESRTMSLAVPVTAMMSDGMRGAPSRVS
jgi:hypothetical protein